MSDKVKYMPQKEFFAAVKELVGQVPMDPEQAADMVAFADHKLEQLNRPKAKRANPEVAEFRAKVTEFVQTLEGEFTNKDVAKHFAVSPQKSASALRTLVEQGVVDAAPGKTKSAGKVYTTVKE